MKYIFIEKKLSNWAIKFLHRKINLAKRQNDFLARSLNEILVVFLSHRENNDQLFSRSFLEYFLQFEDKCKNLFPLKYFKARVTLKKIIIYHLQ